MNLKLTIKIAYHIKFRDKKYQFLLYLREYK